MYKIIIQYPTREVECVKCMNYDWISDYIITIMVSETKTIRASLERADYIEIIDLGDDNETS